VFVAYVFILTLTRALSRVTEGILSRGCFLLHLGLTSALVGACPMLAVLPSLGLVLADGEAPLLNLVVC
jgi:hypothetical protein